MVQDQEVLVKGAQIHKRINELSTIYTERNFEQECVILSSDLYFGLLEYTVLVNESRVNNELLFWELLNHDELMFDTGSRRLRIGVDFFSPRDTVNIC